MRADDCTQPHGRPGRTDSSHVARRRLRATSRSSRPHPTAATLHADDRPQPHGRPGRNRQQPRCTPTTTRNLTVIQAASDSSHVARERPRPTGPLGCGTRAGRTLSVFSALLPSAGHTLGEGGSIGRDTSAAKVR
ncbi:hypothetical protein ACFPM0_10955 [Pseudonocardia sulfidoxydans]|uniref:hypothetical protein n=1 Tax=Pseudonocardia sulfidoxydans TaxID=54011 RepID=UPI0036216290